MLILSKCSLCSLKITISQKFEVKWAWGSIIMNKDSGSDRIPVELFKILKDDAAEVVHSICQHTWKTQQWTQGWKMSVSFQSQRKAVQRMLKLPHNYPIPHASMVIFKILQARLQKYMNWKHPDVQVGFRKGRGARDQIANICWIMDKTKEFQKKTSISASLTMLKPLTSWNTSDFGKFLKRWEY